MRQPPSSPSPTPRRVDPRVAQRRETVDRARVDARRKAVVRSTVGLGLIGALVGLVLSPVLAVQNIEVVGFHQTTAAAVARASGLSTGRQPMITVDRVAIAQRVDRLPWVERSVVTRRWPTAVRITLRERSALARLDAAGGIALLDKTGRVLAIVGAAPPGLVALLAPGAVPEPGGVVGAEARAALRVADAVPQPLLHRVTVVRFVAGLGAPTFELDLSGAVSVRLGEAQNLAAKFGAAQAVLSKADAPGVVIDVRVPESPTVTRGKAA